LQPLKFVELEDLEALLSVLGPSPLARLMDRIHEAGIDADAQQWFHDSLARQPTRPASITDRMDRLFPERVTHLGFDEGTFDRWKAERGQAPETFVSGDQCGGSCRVTTRWATRRARPSSIDWAAGLHEEWIDSPRFRPAPGG
jgi:hypothetical protein